MPMNITRMFWKHCAASVTTTTKNKVANQETVVAVNLPTFLYGCSRSFPIIMTITTKIKISMQRNYIRNASGKNITLENRNTWYKSRSQTEKND